MPSNRLPRRVYRWYQRRSSSALSNEFENNPLTTIHTICLLALGGEMTNVGSQFWIQIPIIRATVTFEKLLPGPKNPKRGDPLLSLAR
jgi:hypothetical protein